MNRTAPDSVKMPAALIVTAESSVIEPLSSKPAENSSMKPLVDLDADSGRLTWLVDQAVAVVVLAVAAPAGWWTAGRRAAGSCVDRRAGVVDPDRDRAFDREAGQADDLRLAEGVDREPLGASGVLLTSWTTPTVASVTSSPIAPGFTLPFSSRYEPPIGHVAEEDADVQRPEQLLGRRRHWIVKSPFRLKYGANSTVALAIAKRTKSNCSARS